MLTVAALTVLFASGFYGNWLGMAKQRPFQNRRDTSEVFILGRLVETREKGVLSTGGLLGIGDVPTYLVNGEVVANHHLKYAEGLDFDQYWVYRSHPGFQALLYGLFDELTSFRPGTNLAIMRWTVCLFTALVFALFCLWTAHEAGWAPALVVAGVIVACKWTTILGGNLLWVLGAFYLPLLGLSYLFRARTANGAPSLSRLFAWAYILVLAKILLTGFEFITTALVMSSVPLVYYAVLERWRWRASMQRMGALALAMLSALITGLMLVAIQIRSLPAGHDDAFEYLVRAFVRRTSGNEPYPGSSVPEVLRKYLGSDTFSLADSLGLEPGLLSAIVNGNLLVLIPIFVLASTILLARFGPTPDTGSGRVRIALIVATWYSILAPLSWFVVFRQHAAEHYGLDQIVWEMPFVLYGAALVGVVFVRRDRGAGPRESAEP